MLYRLGKLLVEVAESRSGVLAFGFASGLLAAGVQIGITHLTRFLCFTESTLFPAVCIGVFVAALSWIEAEAVRQRRLRVVDDVAKVANLNHNVRNALQAIQYAAHLSVGTGQIQIIDKARTHRRNLA
jgi:hypothetical protein